MIISMCILEPCKYGSTNQLIKQITLEIAFLIFLKKFNKFFVFKI
jgi:hypothetical protein